MTWKHSANNGYYRDPWGINDNQGENSKGNRKNHEPGPPDLENIFRDLSKKFSKFSGGGDDGGKQHYNKQHSLFKIVSITTIFSLLIWIVSGFYTIKETDRGVVTRFGKFHHLVTPGLNWKPLFIDTVRTVNVESVRQLAASGIMLTSDENVVHVEMNVQYRIINPERYLYSVTNVDDSLSQATDSALRGVIGRSSMDRILTEGRTVIRSETQREIDETIRPYDMGLILLDVNFQAARPPEEVKASFDDAIAARENREQYIREAEAYANEVQPRANGQAQRVLEEGLAYKERKVLEAKGEVARFTRILPEYKAFPQITKERLYIESMERILSSTSKVLVNNRNNNMIVLPLDKLINNNKLFNKLNNDDQKKIDLNDSNATDSLMNKNGDTKTLNSDTIKEKRQNNTSRNDRKQREGRK